MLHIDYQIETSQQIPAESDLSLWIKAAAPEITEKEVVVRVVDEAESAELNIFYRGKHGPTNVLSFPFEAPPGAEDGLLGDLLICAPVVAREALEQGKSLDAHWAHIVVHGILHLQGYDHLIEEEAEVMEAKEIEILTGLGFPNPYEELEP